MQLLSFVGIIHCFTLLAIHSSFAMKCFHYDANETDFTRWPAEKICSAESTQCIYAKCQGAEGHIIVPNYIMGCLSPDDNITCKQFEDNCAKHNGTSHCYRCNTHDNCNDGNHPKLVRCYNFNYEVAVELDRYKAMRNVGVGMFNETEHALKHRVEYPRILTKNDYHDLMHLPGGVGMSKCPAIENAHCLNIRCRYPGKGIGWKSVYKGCANAEEKEKMCKKHFKKCKGDIFCPKECYMCDFDLCNGATGNKPIGGVWLAILLLFIANFTI